MPTAIRDLLDANILILEPQVRLREAIELVDQAQAAYVVVDRGDSLFRAFSPAEWRSLARLADPTATLGAALDLQAPGQPPTPALDMTLTRAELDELVAEAERLGITAITVAWANRPVGVVALATLRDELERETLFEQPSGAGGGPPAEPVAAEAAPSQPRRMRRGATRSARPRSVVPPLPMTVAAAPTDALPPVESVHQPVGAEPPEDKPADAGKRNIQPRADVSFPPEVVADVLNVLSISLSTLADAPGVALSPFLVDGEVEQVALQVSVLAPGFAIDGPNVQEVMVPVSGEAEPVDFMLRALPGPEGDKTSTLRVRFRYEGKFVGQVLVQTVVKQAAARRAAATVEPPTPAVLVLTDSPAPDLLIEVNQDDDSPGDFHVYVQSNLPGHRYYQKEAGELKLGAGQTAATYTAALFESIQVMDHETAEMDLAGIGNRLWDKLPQAFRDEYWSLLHDNPAARSVQIITDEAYIPWELLKPYKLESGRRVDAPFWGVSFAIGRWDPARPLPQPLTVKNGYVIVPDYPDPRMKLRYAQREIQALQEICGAQAGGRSRKEVIDLLRKGGMQLIHFACHGKYNGENPDLSELEMEDRPLNATTIAAAAAGVAADRPFVFLNACEVGKEGAALTQLGGWAETFCANGFSGFVGPLWEVDDEVAYEASVLFYRSLVEGATLGEALQRVRRQWSECEDELRFSPTWLAYSLHSDPMLKLAWPGAR